MGPRKRTDRRRVRSAVVGVFVLAVAAAPAACSTTPGAEPPGAPTGTGAAASAPPATDARTAGTIGTDVTSITVAVEDAALGRLTFDAIAAGDPAAAADGKLVLLLHGFPETGAGYRSMLPRLAAEGYYAVAPNQRGYSPGARPAETDSYTVDKLAGDVLGMASSLGAERFHVVGHDWGGAVAWVTAVIGADRVSSVTSLSTPHPDAMADAYEDANGEQQRMSGYMAVFRQPGYENQLLADGPEGYVRFITAGGLPEAAAREYAEVVGEVPAMKAALDWYRANPLPAPVKVTLGPTTMTTLYVWGGKDRFLGRTAAEATAAHVTGSYRFVELPTADHWIPEKDGDAVLEVLLPHLASA